MTRDLNRRAVASALRAALLSLLMFAASAPSWALDLADGRIRLTLNEGIGRFSISCQSRGSSGVFVPLLAAQDPRTTAVGIVVGNKIYRMGESSEFSEKAEKTPTGGRFTWKSTFLQVTETFTFIASTGSSVTDGVRIDLSMKNLSEQDITAGVRYLFDTYLGESSFIHFRTNALTQVTHETTLTSADKAAYWVSPLAGDADNFGFQVMLSGQGVTVPDRVIFANWKRLSDASWSYETSTVRNFSLLPYSVNDSAAAQYYDPRPIPRAGEATITIVAGVFAKSGFGAAAASAQDLSTSIQQSLTAAKSASDTGQAVRTDLSTVNQILARIDAAIAAGTTISDDDLALLQSALKDLAGRVSRYSTPGK
jgi:hypothetical protein